MGIIKIRKNKALKWAPYLFVLILGILFVRYQIRVAHLKKYKGLTTGKIVDFRKDYRGSGGTLVYEFELNGKIHRRENGYSNIYTSKGNSLVGRYFPVVYDTSNIANCLMLVTPKNFDAFSMPFPDSLNWVKEYENK